MKILSVAIPCYNSAAYMSHAIETLLTSGDEIEILIVDDGSTKDNTLEIAKEYEKKYPNIVRAIHQENGGHGAAVNTGIENATGIFFKVVDSDDWVNTDALAKVMTFLHGVVADGKNLDMLLFNYVYEKVSENKSVIMGYRNCLPVSKFFTWNDIGKFRKSQYILMHSVVYRTKLLRDIKLKLPEHTFYVDNIFVYNPLPYVKTMYYMDVNFYRYFIGREDQSVNEKVMISRIDQQIKVTKIMIDSYDLTKIRNPKLRNYMLSYLIMMMTISTVLLIRSGSKENLEKKKELWQYLKEKNIFMYRMVQHSVLGFCMQLPGKPGRNFIVWGYKLARRIYKFN